MSDKQKQIFQIVLGLLLGAGLLLAVYWPSGVSHKAGIAFLGHKSLDTTLLSTEDEYERPEDGSCIAYNYIKIQNHLFKIHKDNTQGIFLNRKMIPPSARCWSSPKEPMQADQLSFKRRIDLPGFDKSYEAQFIIALHPRRQDSLGRIKKELKKKGGEISKLGKIADFYRYVENEDFQKASYIATDESLIDVNGNPIVLDSCYPETSSNFHFLTCNLSFEWKEGVRVTIREANGDLTGVEGLKLIKIWKDIFPIYLGILDDVIVSIMVDVQGN